MSQSSGTDNGSVVDDMVGAVGGGVSLDRDLGNMVNLVVDIVANVLDNWCSGNSDRGSVDSSDWGGVDSSNGSGVDSGNWGGNMVGGVGGNSGSNGSSVGNGGHSWGSSDGVSGSISASYKTMMSKKTVTVGAGNELSIGISDRGGKATSNNSGENSLYEDFIEKFLDQN